MERIRFGLIEKICVWFAVTIVLCTVIIPMAILLFREGTSYTLIVNETEDMITTTIRESKMQFQSSKIQDYMYDGSNLSVDYLNYLNNLESIANSKGYSDLNEIVYFLRNGDHGVNYNPLNFDFAYLNLYKLNQLFRENLNTKFINSTINNTVTGSMGDKVGAAIIGKERYTLLNTNIECTRFDVYDITNINQNEVGLSVSENERRKGLYYAIYGTSDPNACKIRADIAGITDRKYLVVYTLRYSVTYRIYFTSSLAQVKPGSDREAQLPSDAAPRNSLGYFAYPNITEINESLYYIVN